MPRRDPSNRERLKLPSNLWGLTSLGARGLQDGREEVVPPLPAVAEAVAPLDLPGELAHAVVDLQFP